MNQPTIIRPWHRVLFGRLALTLPLLARSAGSRVHTGFGTDDLWFLTCMALHFTNVTL